MIKVSPETFFYYLKNSIMKTLTESIISKRGSSPSYKPRILISSPSVRHHGGNTNIVEYNINIEDFSFLRSEIDKNILKQLSKFLDSVLFEKRKSVKIKNITEEVLDKFGCNLEDNDSVYTIFNVFGDKYVSMNNIAHPGSYFPFSECKDFISYCIEDWLPKTKTGNISATYTITQNKITSVEINFI